MSDRDTAVQLYRDQQLKETRSWLTHLQILPRTSGLVDVIVATRQRCAPI